MKKEIRLIALLVLAIITASLLWKFVPWATLSAKYEAFSTSDLSPVWYYSTVVTVALLIMVVIWFMLQIIPKRQAQALLKSRKKIITDERGIAIFSSQSSIKPTELFSIENEARKTLSQIIGGFIVIVSVILTGANLAITQGQAEKNRGLALEGQITDRFTKAITQLDRKNGMEVRLGGIYALERIANDSEKDHWTIMEILSAYVRENAPLKQGKEVSSFILPTDIQAILTVIGRRKAKRETNEIDLTNTNLSRAYFDGDFGKVNFGGACLRGAIFRSANLSRANLSGTDLSEAVLRTVNLSGAKLIGSDLSNADLEEARLDGADLSRADMSRTNLYKVGFYGANLYRAGLSTASGLTWEQVSNASIDDDTRLPPSIEYQYKEGLRVMREKTNKERESE